MSEPEPPTPPRGRPVEADWLHAEEKDEKQEQKAERKDAREAEREGDRGRGGGGSRD